MLRDVYGVEASKDRQCRNWYDKFRSRDFSLKDEQRSGRLNEVDFNQTKAIIELDRHVTVRNNILGSIKNLIFGFHMNWKKFI